MLVFDERGRPKNPGKELFGAGACFSKVPKAFRARKFRPAYSVKLVFSYVVKGIKVKISAKFRASRRLRFEDTKGTMSPEMGPKSFYRRHIILKQ